MQLASWVKLMNEQLYKVMVSNSGEGEVHFSQTSLNDKANPFVNGRVAVNRGDEIFQQNQFYSASELCTQSSRTQFQIVYPLLKPESSSISRGTMVFDELNIGQIAEPNIRASTSFQGQGSHFFLPFNILYNYFSLFQFSGYFILLLFNCFLILPLFFSKLFIFIMSKILLYIVWLKIKIYYETNITTLLAKKFSFYFIYDYKGLHNQLTFMCIQI